MVDSNIRVAVLGAGFGGLAVVKKLANNRCCFIDLIDRRNYHLFQPFLYQVAVAGLSPSDIAVPIRRLFSDALRVRVVLAEVQQVDIANARVKFDDQWTSYDYVVVACGAKHHYFNQDNWEVFAPGLKSLEQATEIRRRILTAFELADKEKNQLLRKTLLTFVVIGGGPTGVELAGAIAELARKNLFREYRVAKLKETEVYLIESGPRILSSFPEQLSKRAERDLANLGVQVLKGTTAASVSGSGLMAGRKWISSSTLIWAAGVVPVSAVTDIEGPKDPLGRLLVETDLSLRRNSKVFVIGDAAAVADGAGTFLPSLAPVAIQQGHFVANQIANDLRSHKREIFKYRNYGVMATIGRSRAILHWGRFQLVGLPAWIIWVFVHIISLMNFKSRVFVFLQWTWSYFYFGNGARLIIHKNWRFYGSKGLTPYHGTESITPK